MPKRPPMKCSADEVDPDAGKDKGDVDESEVELKTVPFDPRWPSQNQTRYCWYMFVDYHRCTRIRGDDYEPCQYFKNAYQGLCPTFWVDKWDDQLEAGNFPFRFPPRKGEEEENGNGNGNGNGNANENAKTGDDCAKEDVKGKGKKLRPVRL